MGAYRCSCYTLAEFPDLIETIGQPLQNANETLEKASVLKLAQVSLSGVGEALW